MSEWNEEKHESFRAYAQENLTEPDGTQSQWADYTLQALAHIKELEQRHRGFLEDRALVEPLIQRATDYQKRIEELEREVERLKVDVAWEAVTALNEMVTSVRVALAAEREAHEQTKAVLHEAEEQSSFFTRFHAAEREKVRKLREEARQAAAYYDLAQRMGETGGPGLRLPKDAAEVAWRMREYLRAALHDEEPKL